MSFRLVSRANDDDDTKANNTDGNYKSGKKPFTLEETYLNLFYGSRFNGTWISDTEILIPDIMSNDLHVYDVLTGKSQLIFDGSKLPVRIEEVLYLNRIYLNWNFHDIVPIVHGKKNSTIKWTMPRE